jgi:hypothetical protein
MSTNPQADAKAPAVKKTAPVIRSTLEATQAAPSVSLARALPAWIISAVLHAVFLLLFYFVTLPAIKAEANVEVAASEVQTQIEEEERKNDTDLTNTEMGNDPEVATNYNVDRLADISVPGIVVPGEAIGIPGAPEGPAMTVAPPPGIGRGTGAGVEGPFSGNAETIQGLAGGFGGGMKNWPGGFAGRSAATREKMATEGGGSKESEARVGMGLVWLASHQASNGSWSLNRFNQSAHDKPTLLSRSFVCNCKGTGQSNDTAATAFGVLPFLAAGITHRSTNQMKIDYTKTVEGALRFLMSRQNQRDGDYTGGMYAHGLAAIAMCEAYGLTSDPSLKVSAQKAINYIVAAQDPSCGGWRYSPRAGGDTSVVGWQVMALKSGEMSGLAVPETTLRGARKWLDSVQTSDGGGYGYTTQGDAPTMTAVGLLCRQYLGWTPRNPGLLSGVSRLKQFPPGRMNSMYYYYYATQVMHHMGGESWVDWNDKMLPLLLSKQDNGKEPKRPHQRGSWSPESDAHGAQGGRMMQTSLSMLTLEVYYRHLPLYRRDLGTGKTAKAETK